MRRSLMRGAWLTVLLLTAGLARTWAHNVTPEPIVEITVKPDGDRLTVLARLPIAALADANLPRTPDRHYATAEAAEALGVVAKGFASDLELEQGNDRLPLPSITTSMSPDEAFVDFTLEYVVRPGAADLSARLHTFRAGGQVLRTVAHYPVDANTTRTFSVDGAPQRVDFNPAAWSSIQHFLVRGADILLEASDVLLLALCLVVAPRRKGELARAAGALVTAEFAGALLSGAGVVSLTPAALLILQGLAASVVVVVAIQNVVNPQSRWLTVLALAFGLASGLSTGAVFLGESSFAGSHHVLGLGAFLLVILMGQVWVIALLSSAMGLALGWGVPGRLATLTLTIVAGHAALHRVVDRAQLLADLGSTPLERALTILTLAWAIAILCGGIIEAMWSGAAPTGARANSQDGARS